MTEQDNILRLAREAGFGIEQGFFQLRINGYADDLARFAALVKAEAVAETREACAKVCESRSTPGTGSVAILGGAADAIRAMAAAPSREGEK